MVDEIKVKKGKTSKAQGSAFELRVRADLEEKGWIVDKWTNNVEFREISSIHSGVDPYGVGMSKEELEEAKGFKLHKTVEDKASHIWGRLIRAKNKWAGPGRPMMMGAGFVDFIAFKPLNDALRKCFAKEFKVEIPNYMVYEVIGVESKMEGELSKIEKEKCVWLLENKIFSKILIAEKTKVKNKVVIVYNDFKEKYRRFYK